MPDNIEEVHIQQVIFAPRAVDMAILCGKHSDEAIEAAVERFYVNTAISAARNAPNLGHGAD